MTNPIVRMQANFAGSHFNILKDSVISIEKELGMLPQPEIKFSTQRRVD